MLPENDKKVMGQFSQFNRRYILQSMLGSGGMGAVYSTFDRLTGNYVALKRVLAPWEYLGQDAPSDTVDIRFSLAQEFQTLASLRHPNIIGVLDYGFDSERRPYFTMELLRDAQPITEAIDGQSLDMQIDLLAQLLRALVYLHQRQILHRDLKPNNILVENGTVKVVDFGLSINTAIANSTEGNAAGTLSYIAPEILQGGSASIASDLYAVGIVAYQMFAGKRPFELSNQIALLINKIMYHAPDLGALKLDPPLTQFIERLLAKAPQDRFQSAKESFYALQQATGHALRLETKSTREGFLQASQYIGRDKELAILLSALSAAAEGLGSAHLVAGESGMGKSRLFHELKTRAQVAGTLVIAGQSITESSTPYQLWRECFRWLVILVDLFEEEASVLKAVVPDMAALLGREVQDPLPLGPQSTRLRLHQTVGQLLVRQTHPLVILLEDLQWASEEDLALLEYISQLAPQMSVLILGNYRDEERPNLAVRLPNMQFMKIHRLTENEIIELSKSMLGRTQPAVADLLVNQTDGNVYFLVEIVRALAEEAGQLDAVGNRTLPSHIFTGGIQRIVARRLDQIPSEDRDLLAFAAVAGRQVDLPVVRTIVSGTLLERWLLTCATVGVLEIYEEKWRFVHDKLREGVLHNLDDSRRGDLHRKVAVAIEIVYPDRDNQAARLAYHWGMAGDADAEAHYALIAAHSAHDLFAIHEATLHYSQALRALEKLPDSVENRRIRVDAMIRRAEIALTLVQPSVNLAQLADAERLVRTISTFGSEHGIVSYIEDTDQVRMGKIQLQIGHAYFNISNLPTATQHYWEALRIGQEFNDDELISQPSAVLGRLFAVQGRNIEAEPLLVSAGVLLDKLNLGHQWARTIPLLALTRAGRGHCAEGLARLSSTRERAYALNDLAAVTLTYTTACAIYITGYYDFDAAAREAYEALRVAQEVKDLTSLYIPCGYVAWVETRRGNHELAAQYRERANEIANSVGGFLLWTDSFFGIEAEIELNAGNREEALTLATKALAFAIQVSSFLNQVRVHRLLGLIYASADWEKSNAHFAAGVKIAEPNDLRMEAMNIHVSWGQVLWERGNIAAAREHLEIAAVQFRASDLLLRLAEVERQLSPL